MSFFKKGKFQKLAIFTGALLASGSLWTLSTVPVLAAATNSLYLSSSASSVQQGSSFTVSLRLNPDPSKPVDSVQGAVGYDTSKLTLQGVDCTGSPFTPEPTAALGCPTSGNPVTITGANFSGGVGADSFVASFTFKAVAGSGTSSITVNGDSAINGTPQGASNVGTSISFTTPPPPTCGAGQTGTYPNCVTTKTGGTGSTGSGGGTTAPSTKTTTPTTTNTTATKTTTADGTTTVGAKTVQYTQASISVTSTSPTQVYIQFGTAANALTQQTALSELGTTHKVTINPQLLTPGQTYYYVVVSKTQAGVITQTNVDSFTMNGLTVRIGVFDKNNKPLTAQQVTLHSTPVTAKTDAKGYASFSNIMPGTHQVIYTSGGKTYTQQITVDNTVTTAGDTQTAPVQTISVVYNLTASKSLAATYRWIVLGLLLVVVIVAVVLYSQRKLRFAAPGGTPLGGAPIVVGGDSKSSPISTGTGGSTVPKSVETTQRLNSIPDPNKPTPGSTVGPEPSQRKQF